MNAARSSALLPTLALTGAMVLWGSSFVAMKIILDTFDPMVMVFGRMAVACVCLLPFWKRLKAQPYRKGDWKYLGFMALCEPCLYFVFESNALTLTTASQAGMITSMLPLLVAVAARFVLGERITRRTTVGFTLAVAGALGLSLAGQATETAPNPFLGNFLEFTAMVCATGYIVTMKHLTSRYSPQFLTAFQAMSGTVFFLPLIFAPGTELPTSFPLMPTLGVVYLGAFITLGAYGLYNYGTSKVTASQASVFINLLPVVTVILGGIVLGETFTPPQFAASALVLAGVFISNSKKSKA